MRELRIEDVGKPGAAGASRGKLFIALIVLGDELRPPAEALDAYCAPGAPLLPHYHIDRRGRISRLVAEERAGRGLGRARYQGFSQPLDPIALNILLQKRPTAGYDGPLLRALHALLGELYARHGLDDAAVARVSRDRPGGALVLPYVAPPAPRLGLAVDAGRSSVR